ncbi:MAG: hypothetical protein IT318_11625 [Anaerolineales bacterium]|nr:hypothetical protein [Anaerolineales bacterium]
MEIAVKEYTTPEGRLDFLLVGLEAFEDFEVVVKALAEQRNNPIDQYNGIWWRRATYTLPDGETFELRYHEDAGTYAYTNSQSTAANHELRNTLQSLIERIQ